MSAIADSGVTGLSGGKAAATVTAAGVEAYALVVGPLVVLALLLIKLGL